MMETLRKSLDVKVTSVMETVVPPQGNPELHKQLSKSSQKINVIGSKT